MLHRFDTDTSFRVLSTNPFERNGEKCTFGKITLIYGRNGSGKTTLSELVRRAVKGVVDDEPTLVTARFGSPGNAVSVVLTPDEHAGRVFVYNKHYVDDTLRIFLDGHGESPSILKLGAANVAAAQRLEQIRGRLMRLDSRLAAIRSTAGVLSRERDSLEKAMKAEVIASLNEGDPLSYNPTRYRIDKVRAALTDSSNAALSENELARERDIANASAIEPLGRFSWPQVPDEERTLLNDELLGVTVESHVMPRLAANPLAARWIRSGVDLHSIGDVCQFCETGVLTEDLLRAYALHFSEALKVLEGRLEKALAHFHAVLLSLDHSVAGWPSAEHILPIYRQRFSEQQELWVAHCARLRVQVEEAVQRLHERAVDPLNPLPAAARVGGPFESFDVESLVTLWNSHDRDCGDQATRKSQAQKAVEGHFASTYSADYEQLSARIRLADQTASKLRAIRARWLDEELELQQSQDDTGRMANLIDADLQEHFGLAHLRVTVSADRKGYIVQRGAEVAERLSEGERNAIALSYFLRSLQGEGIEASRSVVMIDDPVTSLDKEALFAAFALVQERSKAFSQVVILTHDFEYFRLLIGHTRNRREKSEKRIREGDREEEAFPAVAVLEVVAATDADGRRSSALRRVPRELLQHPNEYHYLFRRVLDGIAGTRRDELPLLGNAARRLVDGFMSFREPQGSDFQARADALVNRAQIDSVLARRVVTFMHGQSHREEPRPTSALDFPAVEDELQAVMAFIKAADPAHFSAMCRAVGAQEPSFAS